MFTLRSYRPGDSAAVEKINADMARSLLKNPDVLTDTALSVTDRGRLIGTGFLSASAEFHYLLRQCPEAASRLGISPFPEFSASSAERRADRECAAPPADFGLFAEFQGAGAKEIEVSAALLSALLDKKAGIAALFPGKNIHATIWCRESREAYADFLGEFGFLRKRALLSLKKSLFSEECEYRPEGGAAPSLPGGLFFDEPGLTEPGPMDRYIYGNGLGFGYPDSRGNMLYRMEVLGARALTVTDGREVLASVTLYPDGDGAATEDVFCVPEYRRRGLTSALLKEAFRRLQAEGFREVHLNVCEDNAPALSLYRSLGYTQSDRILELWG